MNGLHQIQITITLQISYVCITICIINNRLRSIFNFPNLKLFYCIIFQSIFLRFTINLLSIGLQ